MSDRVCYIRRTDRGAALRGLRLIGAHTDDAWAAGPSVDPLLIEQSVREAARWISDRLGASGKPRSLGLLCLDPDGAVCSWVKPEEADPTLLDAAITSDAQGYDPDSLHSVAQSGISDRFPKLPLELSFEPLDAGDTSTGSRAAVMALPDVPGRLLKDELDALGIRVERFISIWHAIAGVWDPGSGHAKSDAQRIVSSQAPIAAAIVLDPADGRLVWTWSREGRLIASGSIRIATIQGEHERMALVREEQISRLCGDWLSWSSQLGVAPSRIVFVGKPARLPRDDGAEPGAEDPSRGLAAAGLGAAISRRWPEATIDLIEHEDPIGETLLRIATGQRGEGLVSLLSLGSRPTRAHRSMYRWAGAALVGAAAVISLVAYQFLAHASAISDRTSEIEISRMNVINDFDPQLAISAIPTRDLQTRLDQLRNSRGPLKVAQSKPILEELETLSYVFGIPGIEIDTIRLNITGVTVTVRVENISQAEQLNQSLGAIRGSHLRWSSMTPSNRGDRIQATFNARWIDGEGSQ